MLQQYIRALADFSVNVKTYQLSISGAVARDELNNPVPSDCVKKWHHTYMLQVFYLSITFLSRDLECSRQHEIDVAVGFFFVINGMLTIFLKFF